MKNKEIKNILVNEIVEKINALFDKYMHGFSGNNRLKEFMADESNLYDANGLPTEAYKQYISDMENYVTSTSIKPLIIESYAKDDQDREVIEGIFEFVSERREILRQFAKAKASSEDKRETFDSNAFLTELVMSNTSSPEEEAKLIGIMTDMAREDALYGLSDEDVAKTIKNFIAGDKDGVL